MVDDVFGVDFPNEAGNFLLDLPFTIDEENGDDGRDENESQHASGDLRVSLPIIPVAALLVAVAARRFIQWLPLTNPRNFVRQSKLL